VFESILNQAVGAKRPLVPNNLTATAVWYDWHELDGPHLCHPLYAWVAVVRDGTLREPFGDI